MVAELHSNTQSGAFTVRLSHCHLASMPTRKFRVLLGCLQAGYCQALWLRVHPAPTSGRGILIGTISDSDISGAFANDRPRIVMLVFVSAIRAEVALMNCTSSTFVLK